MAELLDLEKKWLELILAQDFLGRDIIQGQLEQVTVRERDIRDSWCDLALETSCQECYRPDIKGYIRIEVEAIQDDDVPVLLILDLFDGFISYLAVVNLAGYPLDYEHISFEKLVYLPHT